MKRRVAAEWRAHGPGPYDDVSSALWAELVARALQAYFRGDGWDGASRRERLGAVNLALAHYTNSRVSTMAASGRGDMSETVG